VALRSFSDAAPARREVVVPAYTCYSIPSVIVRAGLVPRLVDLAPHGFGMDEEALAATVGDRTLAVIVPHLLGYPTDLKPVTELAQKHGFRVIDDAAQAFGARQRARQCGAGGDVGLLSFGRGKPTTCLGGGALICDDPALVRMLEPRAEQLDSPGRLASTRTLVEVAFYSKLLQPELYWLPAKLPFLKIGETAFDFDYRVRGLAAFKHGLLRVAIRRLDQVNECRRRVAERLERRLAGLEGVQLIVASRDSYATYLRFPVVLRGREVRERAEAALHDAGISAGGLYPRALNQTAELAATCPDHGRAFPNAERMARCLLTLPTYPFVSSDDLDTMDAVLRGCQAGGAERNGARRLPAAEAVGS